MDFSALSGLIGGLAQGYGVWQQGKLAKQLLKLQKQDYYDEKNRRKQSQARLNLAADRAFTHKYDNAALPLAH